MALEGTHIRFALDLKNKYQIKNMERYIIGAIYPDSRHITGIDRSLTHPNDFMDWHDDTADDFKKGWLIHLLTDKIQWQTIKENLPDIFENSINQDDEIWVKHTAIKILRDLDDIKKFDIKQCLPYLEFIENPNGEDFKKLEEYNQLISKMYADPTKIDINSCYEMWKRFGIGDEWATKIRIQAEEYNKDKMVMTAIQEIYQKTLDKINAL